MLVLSSIPQTISTQKADEKTSYLSLSHALSWPQPSRMSCPLSAPATRLQHCMPDFQQHKNSKDLQGTRLVLMSCSALTSSPAFQYSGSWLLNLSLTTLLSCGPSSLYESPPCASSPEGPGKPGLRPHISGLMKEETESTTLPDNVSSTTWPRRSWARGASVATWWYSRSTSSFLR